MPHAAAVAIRRFYAADDYAMLRARYAMPRYDMLRVLLRVPCGGGGALSALFDTIVYCYARFAHTPSLRCAPVFMRLRHCRHADIFAAGH